MLYWSGNKAIKDAVREKKMNNQLSDFEHRISNSSVLLSIFKRKGGEGLLTKIITDDNKVNYQNQLILLEEGEEPILCFKEDELNWLLLTNKQIVYEQAGRYFSIMFSGLIEANLAMHEELKSGVKDKTNFTHLVLKHRNRNEFIIKVEKGEPYQGVYQIVSYLALKK